MIMTVCVYRLRLAKLNEQMKEDSDMGKTDDTFQEVFREFSNMASNNPELLRRNIPIDQSEHSVPIEEKSEQSTTPEQSKQPTKPEQSKQSTTSEQSKQPTDGQSKQSTNITEQNPT
jgi:hypothetical protein